MTNDERLDRIEQSIQRLVARIERIETVSRSVTDAEGVDQPTHPAAPAVGSAADEATPTVPSAASVLESNALDEAPSVSLPSPPLPIPSAAVGPKGPPARPPVASRRPGMEQVVGTRLVAIAGGLLVALAAAFFAKLAYDRGWVGAIPPLVRACSLALLGAGFLGIADVLRRRLGRPAAVGLALAGLGTLYVDAWAIGNVLDLVPPEGAITALAVTTLVGLVVTARFGSMLLGAVSLVAGGAAPYVVGGSPSVVAPGLYFTALVAAGMAASIVRPHPFVRLRPVSLVVVGGMAMPWWIGAIDAGATTVLLLVSIAWWGIVHATSLVAGLRGLDWKVGTALNLLSTAAIAIPVPISVSSLGGGPGLAAAEGWMVLGFAIATVAMTFQFGPGIAALSPPPPGLRRRERCGHRLAETMWLESAVLGLLAAALLLRGGFLPIAWVGIALAVAVFAKRRGSRRAAIFAGIAAVLAQFAASWMGLVSLAPAAARTTVLSGTPFELWATWEFVVVVVTAAGTVATALWWPPVPDGRRTTVGPASVLACGVLPWLMPALFVGAVGTGTLLLVAPIGAAALVTRRRADGAAWRFGIIWAGLALLPMTAILTLPVVASFEGGRGLPGWAADVRTVLRNQGGTALVMFGLVMSQVLGLAAIAGLGRTARLGTHPVDARAVASMRLLPVAVVPIAAAAAMVLLPTTTAGWSVWTGPPMIGAAGIAATMATFMVLQVRGIRLASAPWVSSLAIAAAVLWLVAAVAVVFGSKLGPSDPPILVNARMSSGIVLLVMLVIVARSSIRIGAPGGASVIGTAAIVGLALGSVLVQDVAGRGTLGASTGISIWWAMYAIGLIAAGFRFDQPRSRQAGLGLLAVTSVKFLVLDLGQAETIHRIVSALGVGLLMVFTSVIYVRAGRGESAGSIEENVEDAS